MAAAAGHAVVPKFGSWDAENIGYTVFFEKVRDNKAPPAPAAPKPPSAASGGGGNGGYDFDPYEHYESLSRKVPSRPPSSHGGQPTSARAPVAGGGGYDFDPYEHYDTLSGRNVPSRPPSSHGHARAAPGYDDFDPYEHYENLSARNVPSRPPSSHGHGHAPAPQPHHRPHQHPHPGHGYHRRTGSNGSTAVSEASSRGSKFSPPRPYQPRYNSSSNSNNDSSGFPAQPQSGGHNAQYHHHGAPSPPRHHHHAPPPPPPRRPNPKPSAVPRFGVWDEKNAAMAAQGFTVQFEKVKRNREEAKTAPAPPPVQAPKLLSPDHAAVAAPRVRRHGKRKAERSFMSRMYRCLFPRVREGEAAT